MQALPCIEQLVCLYFLIDHSLYEAGPHLLFFVYSQHPVKGILETKQAGLGGSWGPLNAEVMTWSHQKAYIHRG